MPTLKRVLPLLDSAFPPDEDLIFYSREPEPEELETPYHCLVRGKPVWGQLMILKRAGKTLVNMERADIPRAYAFITEKRQTP